MGILLPVLLALVFACLTGCTRAKDAFFDYKVKAATEYAEFNDRDKIHIILCGTGTPQQTERLRAQACTVVAAGGQIFLFDAGEGAAGSLEALRIPSAEIANIFITHWHSDHFNGLGAVVNHSWISGRSRALTVYGPPGVDSIMRGLREAYAVDAAFRTDQLSARKNLAFAEPHEISLARDQMTKRVFERDGVTVDAYRMMHFPAEPSYGYIVSYQGRKIFISGDTRVEQSYLPAMQQADVVVHEAAQQELLHGAADAMRRLGLIKRAALTESLADTHADTLQLADMAQAASVKHLVLTHLIPAPDSMLAKLLFVDGMRKRYSGQITLGEDGTHIVVPVAP